MSLELGDRSICDNCGGMIVRVIDPQTGDCWVHMITRKHICPVMVAVPTGVNLGKP